MPPGSDEAELGVRLGREVVFKRLEEIMLTSMISSSPGTLVLVPQVLSFVFGSCDAHLLG
jgi:hypothetical protein